jgi:hypothetical protein
VLFCFPAFECVVIFLLQFQNSISASSLFSFLYVGGRRRGRKSEFSHNFQIKEIECDVIINLLSLYAALMYWGNISNGYHILTCYTWNKGAYSRWNKKIFLRFTSVQIILDSCSFHSRQSQPNGCIFRGM